MPDRWRATVRPPKVFSLTSYLRALFVATPGKYRIIAFIVTSQPFEEGDPMSIKEIQEWPTKGSHILPRKIGKNLYTANHYCVALIYELEKPDRGNDPSLKKPSDLTALVHLEKSNILNELRR
jgi:hypothetical protein